MKRLIVTSSIMLIINACSNGNGGGNVSVNTTNGSCPNGTNAPYCMAVQLVNNGTGQNYINNTNFPISNIRFVVNAPNNNLSSPANSPDLDPNKCQNSVINPGSNCTFYLRLNQTATAVSAIGSANVTINYNINNSMYNNSTSTGSFTFSLYELTNLYTTYNSAGQTNFDAINGAWSVTGYILNQTTNVSTVDTTKTGLLYFGTIQGITAYDISNNYLSQILSPSGATVITNLLSNQINLFTTVQSQDSDLFDFSSLSSSPLSWLSGGSIALPTYTAYNTSASSNSGSFYVVESSNSSNRIPTNSVDACIPSNSTGSVTYICNLESTPIPTVTSIYSLLFVSSSLSANNFTGLFAGADNGIYAETTSNAWKPFNFVPVATEQINSLVELAGIAEANGNYILAGSNTGKFWLINESEISSTNAMAIGSLPVPQPIKFMVYDQLASLSVSAAIVYVATNDSLYGCSFNLTTLTVVCNPLLQAPIPGIVGLNIGSSLNSNLNNPGTLNPTLVTN